MSKLTKSLILEEATRLFALGGDSAFTIRSLAKNLGVAPSVIYYHFDNENTLLREMFDVTNYNLGKERKKLPTVKGTKEMLTQRIQFQLDHAEEIVAVLKYYFTFRKDFPKNNDGFLPDKSALHMEELLQFAKRKGDYNGRHLHADAKVMTHAVNGFLMEYFPYSLEETEKKQLIMRIHNFLYRAMKGGE